MQYLQLALDRVKNLRQPATNFVSGLIVYEPDPDDRTPEAAFKRNIFKTAYMAESVAHSILAGQTPVTTTFGFKPEIFEEIAEKIPAESHEFFRFATAIEQLIAEIERAGGIEIRPRTRKPSTPNHT